jgi:hypothetical protein
LRRIKNVLYQVVENGAHLHPEEWMNMVSAGVERGGTHDLESGGCGVSGGAKHSRGRERRHSLTGEWRMWCVSKCETRWRERGEALMSWRSEDVVCQQVQKKMEGERGGTHKLVSGGCGVSAGAKQNGVSEGRHSQTGECKTCQQAGTIIGIL